MSGGLPPGEAVRGPSSSSTALDPEPTAQTDPLPSFAGPDLAARLTLIMERDRLYDLAL
jgi:hypothetical protein